MVLQLLSEIVASALLGENRSWLFQIYVASYAQLLWIHSIFYQNTDYKSRLFYCASIRLFEQTGPPNTLHLSRIWGRNIYHRLLQTSSRIQPHWVKFTSWLLHQTTVYTTPWKLPCNAMIQVLDSAAHIYFICRNRKDFIDQASFIIVSSRCHHVCRHWISPRSSTGKPWRSASQGVGSPSAHLLQLLSSTLNTWISQSNMPRYHSPDSKGYSRATEYQARIARSAFRNLDLEREPGTFGCCNCTMYQLPNQGSEGVQHRYPYYPSVGQSSSRWPPPQALPLLSIAARNFHQHLDT